MKGIVRIAVLATALSMVVALSACGSSASSSAASSKSASASASATTSTSASASSATTESSAANRYTNDYFGILFNLPSGWAFKDSAELDKLNAQAAEASSTSRVGTAAASADGQTNVVITITEANNETKGQTAETHLKDRVDKTIESAKGGNVSYSSTESLSMFGDAGSIPTMTTKLSIDNNTIYVKQLTMEKNGDFLDIVIEGPTEEAVNAVMNSFEMMSA